MRILCFRRDYLPGQVLGPTFSYQTTTIYFYSIFVQLFFYQSDITQLPGQRYALAVRSGSAGRVVVLSLFAFGRVVAMSLPAVGRVVVVQTVVLLLCADALAWPLA